MSVQLRRDAPTFTPNPWYGGLCVKMSAAIPRSLPVSIPCTVEPALCTDDDDVVNHENEEEEDSPAADGRHLLGSLMDKM